MFNIGEYAVCPGHGVAQVVDIESKTLGDVEKSFYVLKVVSNGMTVMVPTDSETGIRTLVDSDMVGQVYELLKDQDIKVANTTWNRRYREYSNKIKTGSILEIADVLRSLYILKTSKPLSFGEKKMLEDCKGLIVDEITITTNVEKASVTEKIDSLFS